MSLQNNSSNQQTSVIPVSGALIPTVSITRNPNLSAPKINRSLPNEVQLKFKNEWWTGLHPEKCVGFDQQSQTLYALPLINLEICTRQDVIDYFNNTWTLTEILFSSLKNEETYVRSPYHQLRHPLLFYYGHPAVLYINKLRLAGLVDKPVDLYLEKVLETGVDEMSWDDMAKNEMEWPSVSEVHAYRKKIYDLVLNVIKYHPDLDLEKRKNNQAIKLNLHHPLWALFMGFEHEKIHFETTSVLIRELPIELVETPKYWLKMYENKSFDENKLDLNSKQLIDIKIKKQIKLDQPLKNSWIKIKEQSVRYGKTEAVPSFGWDNEYGQRSTQTKSFQVTQKLISNKCFYEFVSSGAYQLDQYWQPEGLMWRKFRNTKRPTFWVAYGPEGLHDYKLRTIFEIIDMPWEWPAEVNFHEAQAFCRWRNEIDQSPLHYRLLTEPEHVILKKNLSTDPVLQRKAYENSQKSELSIQNLNLNFRYSSASNVSDEKHFIKLNPELQLQPNSNLSSPTLQKSISENETPIEFGVYDLMGNVWQWAEDQFNPLDDFKIHKLYDDFSTPCFDGKHQMILGGSFISCGHEASIFARFHFRPHFFQHAGFRIAATLDGSDDNASTKLVKSKTYVHKKRENVLDQMESSKDWFKNIDQPLELSSDEIKKSYEVVTQFITEFEKNRAQLSPMGSALDPYTNDIKSEFKWTYQSTKNFPVISENFEKLVEFISNEVVQTGQQPGHPGYMAYVSGAANPLSAPSQAIAMTLNQFTGHYSLSPGLVSLEMEVIKWFTTMVEYTNDLASGVLTSGGSQANLMALVAARNKYFPSTDQSADLSRAKFYASDQVHHCIGKALSFLGFPKSSLQIIESDSDFRIRTDLLEDQIIKDKAAGFTPVALIGTAGATNSGAVDPLDRLAEIAQQNQLWFHVDGAYGALFMLTAKGRFAMYGIQNSDSVALDPHKALQIPYGVGCLLVKDKRTLQTEFAGSSSYMPPSPGLEENLFHKVDFADITPELSRDPRGLRIWLPLKTFGINPFILNLEEKIQLSDFLNSELAQIKEIKMITHPQLTIQTFALESREKTKKLLGWINSQNKLFLSGCEIKGVFHIRVCLLGFRLHFDQVKLLIEQIKSGLKEIG